MLPGPASPPPRPLCVLLCLFTLCLLSGTAPPVRAGEGGEEGYYRQPALHGDTIVFVAEGDLWSVSAQGGSARRLTTHRDAELHPAISPDGQTLAFTARYEGPREVYVMPIEGGPPTRLTYGAGHSWAGVKVVGFTADGRILYATQRHTTLPDTRLVLLDPLTGDQERVPLSQADQGVYSADGTSLYFTRLPFQGSNAKRYAGGSAQKLWRYRQGGKSEAVPLTADHAGTSKNPMVWKGRLYFLTDRDGTMNVWSLDPEAKPSERPHDVRQVTRQDFFDIRSASLHEGRIAYRVGADIRLVDLATGEDGRVDIRIVTDADHTRRKWVENPMSYLTSAHLSPDGSQVVLTSRGRTFVAPVGKGRRVDLRPHGSARNRNARFSSDGKRVRYLSDRTDEVELWERPALGGGTPKQLTKGGTTLRINHVSSPDGRFIAHDDLDARLWLLDTKTAEDHLVEPKSAFELDISTWSPDGRWLVYQVHPPEQMDHGILKLLDTKTLTSIQLTSTTYHSESAAFGRAGKWLYFLSDRNFRSIAGSPWGAHQPEPHYDRQTLLYALALQPGLRPPFQEPDELSRAEAARKKKAAKEKKKPGKAAPGEKKKKDAGNEGPAPKDDPPVGKAPQPATGEPAKKPDTKTDDKPKPVEIALEGLRNRLYRLPVPAGRYNSLLATKSTLLWRAAEGPFVKASSGGGRRWDLEALKLGAEKAEVKTRLSDVGAIELSADATKLLIRKRKGLHVVVANATAPIDGKALAKGAVALAGWRIAIDPKTEWEQMFHDAWRMHRDYFYDPGMHGVDWPAMRAAYAPLVSRVRNRAELQDLTGMLISELSALHASVGGGDRRKGKDQVQVGHLGARFTRDTKAGGYRFVGFYPRDPDEPKQRSPLARPDIDIRAGDVLVALNRRSVFPSREMGQLLVNQIGRQVHLTFRREGRAQDHEAVIKPISGRADAGLRYDGWEYTRRVETETKGAGKIGYIHLRAMGAADMAAFVRQYYPLFQREGLIVDVRHNHGGNIDAWLLSRLIRRAWMHWQGRTGIPYSNMLHAPRGHMVVLCDAGTASDGEAFADGFRRLGLGQVIGTRTWGGEIWLHRGNRLSDKGVASAGMFGVFGEARDGSGTKWLIEGRGVEPDVVVDNLPYETFMGRDRQLEAGIEHLLKRIRAEPHPLPKVPAYPDKSVENNRKK